MFTDLISVDLFTETIVEECPLLLEKICKDYNFSCALSCAFENRAWIHTETGTRFYLGPKRFASLLATIRDQGEDYIDFHRPWSNPEEPNLEAGIIREDVLSSMKEAGWEPEHTDPC